MGSFCQLARARAQAQPNCCQTARTILAMLIIAPILSALQGTVGSRSIEKEAPLALLSLHLSCSSAVLGVCTESGSIELDAARHLPGQQCSQCWVSVYSPMSSHFVCRDCLPPTPSCVGLMTS